jgi:hypothetical protein
MNASPRELRGAKLRRKYVFTYDSVNRWLTRAAMFTHKLPPEFIEMVVRLDDVEGGRRVVTEVGLTRRLTFPGMAQGEVLSPKRFVVSQDPLVRWLIKYGRGKCG